MASQTIVGAVETAHAEIRAEGAVYIVITIALPAGAYPVERATSAAAASVTNTPSLPTLVGQSIDGTIDDATGIISAIAFTA